MIDTLMSWDESLFITLNGWHHPVWDQIMFVISNRNFWIWLYALIIVGVIWKFRINGVLIILGALVSVVLADQITSGFMKPFFGRLRPSHEPALASIVHLVNDYQGGLYGFASSHAANSFALATFLWLNLRKKWRWTGLLFVWAAVVSYSRLYLGVHYPGDLLVGALVGGGLALLVSFIWKNWLTTSLLQYRAKHSRSKGVE